MMPKRQINKDTKFGVGQFKFTYLLKYTSMLLGNLTNLDMFESKKKSYSILHLTASHWKVYKDVCSRAQLKLLKFIYCKSQRKLWSTNKLCSCFFLSVNFPVQGHIQMVFQGRVNAYTVLCFFFVFFLYVCFKVR